MWDGKEGFDFLGMHHRRMTTETSKGQLYKETYQYPSRKAMKMCIRDRNIPAFNYWNESDVEVDNRDAGEVEVWTSQSRPAMLKDESTGYYYIDIHEQHQWISDCKRWNWCRKPGRKEI